MSFARKMRRQQARKHPPIKCRNLAELHQVLAAMGPGCFHTLALHEDWCEPGNCICSPEYRVEPLTAENYIAGRKLQDEWIRSKAS